jgi:hypothetical protein
MPGNSPPMTAPAVEANEIVILDIIAVSKRRRKK